ncbi:MAG: hypothetical protein ACERKN_08010 [Velocimicrobium sp.]
MNEEMKSRIKEAKHYQNLAVKALLPKEAQGHITVIKKEIKAILFECVLELVKQEKAQASTKDREQQEKQIKKVTIQ